MTKQFAGKIALVTGGSQGIGLATVTQLLAASATVVTCGRTTSKWADAVARMPALAAVDFEACDLNNLDAMQNWFATIQARHGRLDIAVNNFAPDNLSQGDFAARTAAEISDAIQTTLVAPAQCLREQIRLMTGGGAIVNVSSVNGFRATPGAALYSAGKHGLEGLTKSLALECIARGIRINAVAPGVTLTPRWEARLAAAASPGEMKTEVEKMVPIQRFGHSDEIANAIVWLCSDAASYVVGHTLVVDGGLSQT